MRIALDAMGSDGAPAIEVTGVLRALPDLPGEARILLVGEEELLAAELKRQGAPTSNRITIVHAPERILAGESPASAIRKKPESSIAVGLRLQLDGEADAFVSAGSTGAVMAGSLFLLRPLPGVARPAISTLLPTAATPVLMLDAGANVDCKPQQLLQFAQLGTIYATDLMGVEKPRVGLLNIGEEPGKGNELAIDTFQLLSESGLNFVGNVEGSDIIQGACDVLVCDGFTGNVLLKFYESVAGFIVSLLKRRLGDEGPDLSDVYRVLNYEEYGGAPLLGVGGVSIICHGKSPPLAISNALHVAARAVQYDMVAHMRRELGDE